MDFGYSLETIMHHLLIRDMTCLGYRDEFPMVSVLIHVMHTGYDLW